MPKFINHDNTILQNPYLLSSVLQKAKHSLLTRGRVRLAFLDIDNTLTGSCDDDTNQVRRKLRSLDYGICFVTARTEEALMSEVAYTKSTKLGFSRPKPRLRRIEGKQEYVDPCEYEPEGLIDPDVIAGSTGTKILLRQEIPGGYSEDEEYNQKMGVTSKHFRESVLGFLSFINRKESICSISAVDSEENYHNKVSDVFPPDFRISIAFETMQAKKQFQEILHSISRENHPFSKFFDVEVLKHIKFTSDGYAKHKLRGYLTPKKVDKAAAAEQVIDMVCRELSISRDQIETLFAGDAFPDLSMGLHAGAGTHAKFVLVGGSRLASYLTQKELIEFAGETFAAIREKLFPTENQGYYSYQFENHHRQVIIADLAYSDTFGPQSILRAMGE